MKTKLYLVNPPNPYNMKGFPGSLLSLDLWVRKNVPEVESTIIDEENTHKTKLEKSLESKLIDSSENLYFGLTSTTATYQDAIETAKVLKKLKPKSTIILGGHHVDRQEGIILDYHPEIDLVVTGEGEKALESILRGNLNAPGVFSRKKLHSNFYMFGQRLPEGERLTKEELNLLTIMEYDERFQSTQFGESNLVTARGCPLDCAFCSVANKKVTAQDPEIVIEQIAYLVERNKSLGIKTDIAIQDNFFAQSPVRAKEIAKELISYKERSGNEFKWNMQTRVEQFEDKELVNLLARAGCSAAYFGIENFDPRLLKFLNKAHNPNKYIEQVGTAIDNCLKIGINPHIDFQVGIPFEDESSEKINEEAFKKIGTLAEKYDQHPIVFPSLSVVYPGTEFHFMLLERGATDNIFEKFTKWERENCEYRKSLYGYFAHGNGGIPIGIGSFYSRLEPEKDFWFEPSPITDWSEFRLNKEKLARVKNYVDRLRKIPGIKVHDYSKVKREE